MENNIKTICVRLNLKKPLHKKAYDYLKNMDKSEFPSNSQAIATAVAEYFDRQGYDEKLVGKIISALEKSVLDWFRINFNSLPSAPENTTLKSEEALSAEIDFDFLGG